MKESSIEGYTPVNVFLLMVIEIKIIESSCLRVQLKLGWYNTPKTKYRWETDSEQVPWGKD